MKRFFVLHWLAPCALMIIASGLLQIVDFDLWFADHIYAYQGYNWRLKESWLLETLIHKGGRTLTATMIVATLATWIASGYLRHLKRYQRGLGYLLLSMLCSLLIVSYLKSVTHISCPWDTVRYGGNQLYIPLMADIFGDGTGRCFPAGHASGGYTWIAAYFFCRRYCPQWQGLALSFGLGLGLVYGISQQFRGAHFISHDLWTLTICWYTALVIYQYLPYQKPSPLLQSQRQSAKFS
jgi:membrane-associated PAP2 superfamily phosphatase